MPKWEDLSPKQRERYVNQDYVGITYNLLYDMEHFSDEDVGIAEKSSCYGLEEYGIDGILNLLTTKQREVVLLYYLKGKSEYKIAKMLGITRGAVQKRLFLAKKRLEEKYKELKNE
jgi:DNA-directed RNA polymerase specialized sigma24 family protein